MWSRTNVLIGALTIGSMAAPAGATCPLPACTIDFDSACPDAMEVCGASFTGGFTCAFEFLEFCYSTGLFSYRVDPGFPLTITLSGDLVDIEVFFANVTGSSGEMRFFNADDQEVGTPFQTNGNCLVVMPAAQSQVFNEPVRRIEVTASGIGPVYIDTFRVNPAFVPPPGDLDGDCSVGIVDFLMLLAAWGPCPVPCPPFCPGDLDGDCNVGITDFLMLLANWTA